MTLAGVPPLWNQFLDGAIIIVALVISRFASGEKQEQRLHGGFARLTPDPREAPSCVPRRRGTPWQ